MRLSPLCPSARVPGRLLLLAAVAVAAAVACGKGHEPKDPEENGNKHSTAPDPTGQVPDGPPLKTFDPELLHTRFKTMDNMVLMPPEASPEGNALLPLVILLRRENGGPYHTISVRIAVECTDAAFEELRRRRDTLYRTITSSFETKTFDYVLSIEGRLDLKEEIIMRLRKAMKQSKGIKEIYYQRYDVHTVVRK